MSMSSRMPHVSQRDLALFGAPGSVLQRLHDVRAFEVRVVGEDLIDVMQELRIKRYLCESTRFLHPWLRQRVEEAMRWRPTKGN